MKDQNVKSVAVKQKRFTVLENGKEVLNTSKRTEAYAKTKELRSELKPLIVLLDNQEKTSIRYRKTIHQKNYRVESGDFDIDTAIPPVAEVVEAEG